MTIVSPGYADVSVLVRHTTLPRVSYVTFGVKNDTGTPDPVAVAEKVFLALIVASGFVANIDNNVVVGPVEVRLGTDGGEPLVGVGTSSQAGALAQTALPPNCALLIHKRTAVGGRRHRGRMFIPWGCAGSNVTETGAVDTTTMNRWQTACNNLRTNLATQLVPMYVLHGLGLSTVPAPDLVTSLTVDSVISTQRRRLGR